MIYSILFPIERVIVRFNATRIWGLAGRPNGQWLAAMRKALKPDGVVVLVEFRAEDPKVPIKPLHKMSKAQILKELEPNGFKLVREFNELPWQHMMFFGRVNDG